MFRYRNKILISTFCVILVLPSVSYPFVKRYIDTENYENRELAEKPELSVTSVTEYPAAYEAWFDDHLPYKNQLQFINRALDLVVFHSLDSDQVLLGKDEWLFYKAAECIDNYRGIYSYSENELKEMEENLRFVWEWFQAKGIELVISIVPNKAEVYSRFMPDDIQVVNPVSLSQQAVEYIQQNTDVPVLYDLDGLQTASERYQVYCKYDTHWNYIGGYYGAKAILGLLGKKLPECTEDMVVEWSESVFKAAPQQRGTTYDLSMMAGLPHLLDVRRDKKYMVNYKPEVQYEFESLESFSDIDTMHYTSDAADQRRVMMVCDSFGNLDMPYIAKEFAECSCIHYSRCTLDFLTEQKPDIVIFQFVERQAQRFDQTILNIISRDEG